MRWSERAVINRDGVTIVVREKGIPICGIDENGEVVETAARAIIRLADLDHTPDEYEEIDGVRRVAIVSVGRRE